MRAAYLDQLGPPENISYGELPDPVPGPDEVLVQVSATSVNRVDTFVRSGQYKTRVNFPFVIGRDLVGRVTRSNSKQFAVGQQVWCNSLGHNGRQGSASELAAVPADRLYPLPDGVSPQEAVALAHPAATAYLAAVTHGGLRKGDTAFIAGAAGNVGSALVSIITRAGGTVLAAANRRDHQHCRQLGAAHTIDYRDANVGNAIRSVAPGGVDLYIDTFGANNLEEAVSVLAIGGRIVLLAGIDSCPRLPAGQLYSKDCSIRGFVISRATVSQLQEAADAINRDLVAGLLRTRSIETLPLSAAAEAHHTVETTGLHGRRLVLDVP